MSEEKIRVVVMGAAGRMGATVCRAVLDAPDMELVAVVDPPHEGRPLDDFGVTGTGLTLEMVGPSVKKADPQVAVDFSNVDGARSNTRWCALNGVHAVVGTTGLTDSDVQDLSGLFDGERANAVVAPNFAIGAVLMMHLAAIDAVTPDDVARVIDRVLAAGPRVLAAVGPVDADDLAERLSVGSATYE